jgi:hypothetical protein
MSPTLRKPSDRAVLYAWHADALDALAQGRKDNLKDLAAEMPDLVPPIQDGEPQCGWFKARVSKRAVLVPAKIYLRSVVGEDGELVEPEKLICEIGDRDFDVLEAWPKLCIRPITASEYQYLMALRQWAKESARDQPQAVDGRPVDWMTVKIPDVPQQPQPKEKSRR